MSGGTEREREACRDHYARHDAPFHSGMMAGDLSQSDLAEFAIESLPIACIIKNSALQYCRVNRAFCTIVGMDPKVYVGKTAHDFFDTETARRFEARERQVFQSGKSIEFEERVARTDGVEIDLLTQINRIVDGSGEYFISITVTEVTELKLAIREKQEHAGLLQESATAMAQGLLVFGCDTIEFVSEKTPRLLDVPDGRLAIGSAWKTMHEGLDDGPGDRPLPYVDALLETIGRAIDKRHAHKLECTTISGKTLLLDHAPRKNGGAIVTVTDITASAQIAHDLEQSRNRAEAADRAKSEFLANMSHEIRTPMNGVMGMAELLARTDLDEKQKMFTGVIAKSGAALLTIIRDILDFSKIDAGQMELDPAPFALAEAIEDVAALMSSGIAEKDLDLFVRIDPNLPKNLVGDVGRIRQIVTNLMGNAVKFTDRGHVHVNVENLCPDAEKCAKATLRFTVEDTGIGIPEPMQKGIFDKFSQVDSSASRKHQGTGLGLSIAASLVELMGGAMGLSSREGVGSTFWFEITLPVAPASARPQSEPLDLAGARVLVVDGNEVNRTIVCEQMAAWKFDGAAVDTGAQALAVMRRAGENGAAVDCVVLDYQIRPLNGAEIVRAMRAEKALADIPVIMLTSVDQMEDGTLFTSLGVAGHLTKPARSSALLEMIGAALQRAPNGRFVRPPREAEQPLQAGGSAAVEASAARDLGRTAGHVDVLVCEDNEVNQIVFTQILQQAGMRFHIAGDGREGVLCYRRLRPDLIIMDVSMPEMNGYEATRAIRELEAGTGHHTPVIGVTAHAIKGDMEKCLQAGMDDYLSKPVSPDKLIGMLESFLGNRRSRRADTP